MVSLYLTTFTFDPMMPFMETENNKQTGALTVGDPRTDVQLKKAVEAIAIKPTIGRITMLMKKTFNVLLHNAMESGSEVEVYKMRLADLIANVSPDSNDYETFKTYLRKMNATQVEWHSKAIDGSEENWGVSSLMAEAEIIKTKSSGFVVEYSYAPKIKKKLLNPGTYANINLRFQSVLRSNAAMTLHEICSRYSTNPSCVTMRETWQWWRPILTGTPDAEAGGEYGEYKYFKRDVLKPAITEVNTLTELTVGLIEHKIGRRVAEIQFSIDRKAQTSFNLGQPPLVDGQLLQRIIALGLTATAAREIYTEHEEALVKVCVENTEARLKNTSLPPVTSPSAYFRSLIKDKLGSPQLALKKTKATEPAPADVKKKLLDAYLASLRQNAKAMFNEAGNDERQAWRDRFEREFLPGNPPVAKAYEKSGLDGSLAQKAFVNWLAEATWGNEPTEAELLDFAIKSKRMG